MMSSDSLSLTNGGEKVKQSKLTSCAPVLHAAFANGELLSRPLF
jgi:hypothetical protein